MFRPLLLAGSLVCLALGAVASGQTLTLGTEELLTASQSYSTNERPRVLFAADGAKHVAWVAGNSFGAEGVFAMRAAGAGAPYGAPVMLSQSMDGVRYGIGDGLSLERNGSYLVASWEGTDFANRPMWFARSTNDGLTWETAARADDGVPVERAYSHGMAFPDGRIAQMWMVYDAATGDPNFEWRAQDGFGVFGPPSYPADGAPDVPCECCAPGQVVLDDGTIVVVFRNNESDRRRIYVARSTDGGATFAPALRVDSGGSSFFACPGSPPMITAEGQDVLVVWGRVGGQWRAMSARSTDGGVTFSPQTEIDDSDGLQSAGQPSVARRGNVAAAVWFAKDPVTSHFEIFAAASVNGGSAWGPAQMITGDGLPGGVGHPGVAISPNDEVEIVWMDERSFPARLYRIGGTVDATSALPTRPNAAGLTASPNPFTSGTRLRFDVARRTDARVVIHDLAGRRVREIVRSLPAGRAELPWDGRDAAGRRVPSGVYFARLESSAGRDVVRLVHVK